MDTTNKKEGITLLVALLLIGVLLGVSTSLLNITLKQYQLSGIALASEVSFQAANAGMECILYYDHPQSGASPFAVNGDGSTVPEEAAISCMDDVSPDLESSNTTVVSGEEQVFEFEWGTSPTVCSQVSVYKFFDTTAPVPVEINGVSYRSTDCPMGSECTVVQARGYNVPCGDVGIDPRVVEREYTQVY